MNRKLQSRRLHLWLLGGLLVTTFFLYTALLERHPTGWDPLGYQVAGENIKRGSGPAVEHPFNRALGPYFTLAAFAVQRPQEPARLYLNYPPGFPLLVAAPQWLGLPDFFVLPVLSTLGVFFVYMLGRLLFDRWTGLLGATIVAFTPVYVEWGTSFWADLPGACFMWGALVAYLAAWHADGWAKQVVLGGVAGVMVVMTVFIKYSSGLVLVPMLAYALFTQRRSTFVSGINWAFGAVVALGLVSVGLYNRVLFGSPLETFYSASRSGFGFPIFSLAYALGPSPADGYSLIGAGKTLWANFSWLLLIAVVGLVGAARGAIVLLGGVFLVFLGLSSAYAWAPLGVDTRYVLPLSAPVGLLVARGVLSVRDLRFSGNKWVFGVVLLLVGVTVAAQLSTSWQRLVERNRSSAAVRQVSQNLTAGSEPNAVFLAYLWNDPINHYGERTTLFYRRMNLRDRGEFERTLTHVVSSLLQGNRPVYYVEDANPPFADSLEILGQRFDLSLWKESPFPVYKVAASE